MGGWVGGGGMRVWAQHARKVAADQPRQGGDPEGKASPSQVSPRRPSPESVVAAVASACTCCCVLPPAAASHCKYALHPYVRGKRVVALSVTEAWGCV